MPEKATRRAAERAGSAPPTPVATWTPQLAGEALVDALRWVRRYGGPVGPVGMGSCMPSYIPNLDDHLAEGWGLPEVAGDPLEDRPIRLLPSPAQVTRFLDVLEWPTRYLCPAHIGSARMVGLWAACKASKRPFGAAVERLGTLSRVHAYRLRDRGHSLMSQGLDRDGVKVET